ncbi:MAG: class I SAM-dependent methyltransferase [Aequorivita sp.]
MNMKNHWETVYKTKNPSQVSWTQKIPQTSLSFIKSLNLSKNAPIVDIGGGDGKLVDFLLDEGFTDISVLDISGKALKRAKQRLGKKSENITWIESDITEFKPERSYDLWHDRAAFHFLTDRKKIDKYLETVRKAVDGYLIIGAFSENGPKKCSGLDIVQYSEETLPQLLKNGFKKLKCITVDHTTPFDTTQNFVFCSFKKKANE